MPFESSTSESSKQDYTTDPSANVLLLVGNAVKYLEALHISSEAAMNERLKVHFEYAKQMADAETKRIDTLRAVDVAAVNTANERAIGQASVLANQVASSAETLRTLVASTANTIAKQFENTTGMLTERIAQLEQARYKDMGASGTPSVVSQRLTDLDTKISKKLTDLDSAISENKGRSGISVPLMIILTSAGVGLAIYIVQLLIK